MVEDKLICLNPRCGHCMENATDVYVNIGTCGRPKCVELVRRFCDSNIVIKYAEEIRLYEQFPEIEQRFLKSRDDFRSQVYQNIINNTSNQPPPPGDTTAHGIESLILDTRRLNFR